MEPTIYFVIPCYNEEAVLPETTRRLAEKLQAMQSAGLIGKDSRVLYVDDGSKDKTWQLISQFHQEYPWVEGVKLAHNRGHQNALLCGLMTAKEGQTDVDNMKGYRMIAELTDFMLSFYGTLHCVELQKLEIVGYENPCHAIVEALAKKLEELLAGRRIFRPANGGQLSC